MATSRTITLLRFDSIRLATGPRVFTADRGDAAGEPVVLLHGWPDSSFSFSRLMAELPPWMRAIAFDQRGFGEAAQAVSSFEVDDYADDVVALLDALEIDRATVVGHAFGSFVARRVAVRAPDRLVGLVLIGSGPTPLNAATAELREQVATLRDPISESFIREVQASTIRRPVPDAFFEGLVVESQKAPAEVWRRSLGSLLRLDDTADLAGIAAPTLILWGDRDSRFGSHPDQLRLAAAIPDAGLVPLPDTGHSPHWERPERVAAEISAFVAAQAHPIGRAPLSADRHISRYTMPPG